MKSRSRPAFGSSTITSSSGASGVAHPQNTALTATAASPMSAAAMHAEYEVGPEMGFDEPLMASKPVKEQPACHGRPERCRQLDACAAGRSSCHGYAAE